MAKCPGCKKDIGDAHLAYHRGKCKKSKDVLRNALQAHHERLKNTLKSIPKSFHPSRDPPPLNRHRGDASRHTLISTLKVIITDFFTLLQSDLLQVTICAQKTQQNSAREDLDPMPAVENPPVDVESSPSSLDPVRNPPQFHCLRHDLGDKDRHPNAMLTLFLPPSANFPLLFDKSGKRG